LIDCTLVTCARFRALDPDDRLLFDELIDRGLNVTIGVWSDPNVDWADSRLCILRSTWDYHSRYHEFTDWVERTATLTTIRNDERLLRWNAHKSYIRELEMLDVPVVPTAWVPQNQNCNLADLCETHGWHDIVIKPARGAAAHDVMLVRQAVASIAAGQAHFDRLAQTQDILVQPYLESVVNYGERALIFFNGCYSHAVVKKPFDTVHVVSNLRSSCIEATDEEIEVATKAVRAIPGQSLYARVDLLRDDERSTRVSEVELIEPALYFAVCKPARARFADAVERELDAVDKKHELQCVGVR
jgi:glutathione synthase/RimK-type ligase-like ATP-grasp enzyme